MKVLMAAFACRPEGGSEPGVGWEMAAGAARAGHSVTLITQPRHRDAIERQLRRDPEVATQLTVSYTGLPARWMELWATRLGLRGLQVYYLVWQLQLYRRARALQRSDTFDVAHHVTLTNEWVPSGLSLIPSIPFVWGPIGGGERVPAACMGYLSRRGRALEWIRRVTADPLQATLGRAAARRAALLVAQNEEEAARLTPSGRPVTVCPNTFLDHSWGSVTPSASPGGGGHVAAFVGRLVSWKGVFLALEVIRHPVLEGWHLHFYGNGPERSALQRRTRREGLSDRVVFHGRRPREEVRTVLQEADVLLFPSLREAAGWSVAEGLAVGCPVVCVDTGGTPQLLRGGGTAVTPDAGLVDGLANAVAAAPGRARTPVLWSTDAVPALLDEWYRQAVSDRARADASC